MRRIYTRDGDAALEARIATICEEVKAGLFERLPRSLLRGIALGGGYGRGEGGVLRDEEFHCDRPYNDVEFFVFTRGPGQLVRRLWAARVDALGHTLTERHGIEVEMRLLGGGELRRAKPSMFYYDLCHGHRWVRGDDSLLADGIHHADAKQLPSEEATRLLMNRASGLVFAAARLAREDFTRDDADFVHRNIAKARLAMGDALLTSAGLYHWSCLVRHERLRDFVTSPSVLDHHREGVAFKLHPVRSRHSREDLAAQHATVSTAMREVFLRIESLRLGVAFADVAAYRAHHPKFPHASTLRNRLIHFRDRGLRGLADTSHPRELLLDQICEVLWSDDRLDPQAGLVRFERLWRRHG